MNRAEQLKVVAEHELQSRFTKEVQFTFGPYMEEHLPFYMWRTGL